MNDQRFAIALRESSDLTDFDAEKSLKKMAVSSAAIEHYRRVRDPEKSFEAMLHKLIERRNFTVWWDRRSTAEKSALAQKRFTEM